MNDEQMRAVFTIVGHEDYETLMNLYKEVSLPLNLVTRGYGTADSVMLELLGLSDTKKVVAMSLMTRHRTKQLFKLLGEKLELNAPGRGIAFSVPISGMSKFLSTLLIQDKNQNPGVETEEEESMPRAYTHELIVTIVAKGMFSEVKAAAASAGAKGGTLIHSLGLGNEETQKFLEISIQPEKDIVLIVVRREEKQKIMEAITKVTGIATEGRGVVFAMPVDKAYGLSEAPMPIPKASSEES
jgi:nitrogen regulatory protein PII